MAMDEQSLDLPPGFRFHPTDEEIITFYLSPKVLNHGEFTTRAVGEVDLNKCEPWDLPSKAKMGEKEWYFFCQRDRKYPTGMRTNRATESGYWKATGKDKEIYRERGVLVGMKKTLVFYRGRAPKGVKTNWVMHEFRLETKSPFSNLPKPTKDEWVVSKVFNKSNGLKKSSFLGDVNGQVRMDSFTNELMESPTLPPLMDPPYLNSGAVGVDNFDANSVMANCAQLNSYSYPSLNDMDDYSQLTLNNRLMSAYCSSSSSNPLPNQNSSFFRRSQDQGAAAAMGGRYCKAEQFSSQSMLSQDTGDRGTEITSVISKMNMGSCASYDRDGGGPMDLANMWRC